MKLDTRSARNVKEARELLAREPFDLCLTDMRLPDGSGLDLVQYIQQRHPTPVAMITAYGSLDTAIQALKAGAFDFLTKPVDLGRCGSGGNRPALAQPGSRGSAGGQPPARRVAADARPAQPDRQAGAQPGAGLHQWRVR